MPRLYIHVDEEKGFEILGWLGLAWLFWVKNVWASLYNRSKYSMIEGGVV